jgi:hypothetical protein
MLALLKFIIGRLWPGLIPLVLYVLWIAFERKIRKNYHITFFGAHFKWVVLATVIAVFISFALVAVQIASEDESYIPSRVENGNITPSQTERR